ncbi:MAG: winged helix-turn-helix transcriptional regulator [Candidatus Helarchaeota archaeon]
MVRIKFSKTQKKILKLIDNGFTEIRTITAKMGLSRTAVHYQLKQLKKKKVIFLKTKFKMGNVKIGEVEFNPLFTHEIRKALNKKLLNHVLFTGCTWNPNYKDEETLKIPEISSMLLEKSNIPVDKIVCFTTPQALKLRKARGYPDLDYYPFEFKIYQDLNVRNVILDVLKKEILSHDIILDMTPLSKIFTITLLDLAHEYKLPIFYLVKSDGAYHLEWYEPLIT